MKYFVFSNFLKNPTSFVISLIVFLWFNPVFAQKDSILIHTKSACISSLNFVSSFEPANDSSIKHFHIFDTAQSVYRFISTTAGSGSPFFEKTYILDSSSTYYPEVYQPSLYFLQPANVLFFDTKIPYTILKYVQGAKDFQSINALHSRNINPLLNVTLNYKIQGFNGFYFHQKQKFSNFSASLNYHTHSQQYMIYTAWISNKYQQECNGGINYPDFKLLNWQKRLLADVSLEESRQFSAGKTFFVFHQLKLNSFDTLTSKPAFIGHRFSWTKASYHFQDDNPMNDYYHNIYFDSLKTNDSFYWTTIENRIFISKYNTQRKSPSLQAGITHVYSVYYGRQSDSVMFSLKPYLHGILNRKQFRLIFFADYVLSGTARNNYSILLKPSYMFKSGGMVYLKTIINKHEAPFQLRYAEFNHLKWNNDFDPVEETAILIGYYSGKHFSTELQYISVKNSVHVTQNLIPEQFSKTLSLYSFILFKTFTVRHFHSDNHLVLQYSADNSLYPLPPWMLNNISYFGFDAFRGNLNLHIGIDARLTSSWYAPFYYAPLNVFYFQDSIKTPFYPIISVFANGKIKRARFFVMFEQPHQYLFKNNSTYIFPDYPANPFTFRFGVSWVFYD